MRQAPSTRRLVRCAVLAGAFAIGATSAASAQTAAIGVRAAGMGGAFTAVADDPTAVYWNPAGLATGAFVGVTLDANRFDAGPAPFAGLVTPPLGISYFRTSSSTGTAASGRNGAREILVVHHVGATVVQSIGRAGLALGGTVGAVHGNGATAFAADVGAMLAGSLGKLGLTVHNLTAPSLGGLRLDRQVRAGVSLRLHQDVTVAADLDLTPARVARSKRERDAAVGAEAQPHRRIWLRGGVHWHPTGPVSAPIGAVGGSVAVYGALRVDAQASFGSRNGNRGWGVGLGVAY